MLELCRCELARAGCYALLARLFYAPPDAALLDRLAVAEDLDADEDLLPQAWQALGWAAARTEVAAVREAYESAFRGIRKPRISLYATAYATSGSRPVSLQALRAALAELGLARHRTSLEPEDHIAGLCDVMRHLIQTPTRALAEQRRFFNRWIAPAGQPLCDAVARQLRHGFYEHVAHFAGAFFAVERVTLFPDNRAALFSRQQH
jgi:TorA maturation chaperone TorD